MASILRRVVATPRAHNADANLDLCYVTDNIIATSGPSSTYPRQAYRNPLKDLVRFLDAKHGSEWAIWEFRAEGTGYPDSEVYGRIKHYPWPDHHPPPFKLIPLVVDSMRDWLKDPQAEGKRVVVVHCKAGKGRSGTASCSYLISEEGWTLQEALQRFTERRMRPGFGAGISIASQVRTVGYVDRWTKHGKRYVERAVEVVELHVWGLRDGVKIAVQGYIQDGKVIKTFHTFAASEREIVRGSIIKESGIADAAWEVIGRSKKATGASQPCSPAREPLTSPTSVDDNAENTAPLRQSDENLPGDVIFRPSARVVVPSSDINIDFERRSHTTYAGLTLVTSVAHAWFNIFFEGNGPEQDGKADNGGVFKLDFDGFDGVKGSSRKGTRAFDKMALVWRAAEMPIQNDDALTKPQIPANESASENAHDLASEESQRSENKLGLRTATAESAVLSSANSQLVNQSDRVPEEIEGVKAHILTDDELAHVDERPKGVTE